jgi:hypothetical protein
MFESLGSAYGYEHKITEWADDKMMRDASGKAIRYFSICSTKT